MAWGRNNAAGSGGGSERAEELQDDPDRTDDDSQREHAELAPNPGAGGNIVAAAATNLASLFGLLSRKAFAEEIIEIPVDRPREVDPTEAPAAPTARSAKVRMPFDGEDAPAAAATFPDPQTATQEDAAGPTTIEQAFEEGLSDGDFGEEAAGETRPLSRRSGEAAPEPRGGPADGAAPDAEEAEDDIAEEPAVSEVPPAEPEQIHAPDPVISGSKEPTIINVLATTGAVAENGPPGTLVATLGTADPQPARPVYRITDASGVPIDDPNFEVLGNEIRVKQGAELDYESAADLDIYIVASDGGTKSAPLRVSVTVDDRAETIVLGDSGAAFIDTGVTEAAIIGGAGDDTIVGTEGADNLSGGVGSDSLLGGGGSDVLVGEAGDDTLDGGAGADALYGGDGSDRLVGGSGDDLLRGDGGMDTASWDGDRADFAIAYDRGTDTFTITDLNPVDGADEGSDRVTGVEVYRFNGVSYTHADMVTEADRQANTAPGGAVLSGGGSVAENSPAGTVVATLTAPDADGDPLTYQITDASGTPVIDSRFEIVGSEVRVKAGADLDFESATSHDLYVTASDQFETSAPRPITVTVSDVAESITLGDGGETFVDTGVTEDDVVGDSGDDTITGSGGIDNLYGGAGNDMLDGGGGDDYLIGDGGNDIILGGDGDDVLEGKTGADTLDGGAGQDMLRGEDGDDSLRGGAGDDTAHGGAGADTLLGGDGADTLYGETEDDRISGGSGDDALYGGTGTDTATWSGDRADFTIAYDSGTDTFTISDMNAGDGDEGPIR